jgi:ankyrin repeat protein
MNVSITKSLFLPVILMFIVSMNACSSDSSKKGNDANLTKTHESPIPSTATPRISPSPPASYAAPRPLRDIDRQLLTAVESGNLKETVRLLDAGADVNAQAEEYGNTPLIRASGAGRLNLVKLLLKRGADVNAKNEGGYTALDVAIEEYDRDISSALKAAGGTAQPDTRSRTDLEAELRQAAIDGDIKTVRTLLAHGVDVNAADEKGWTPLRSAVFQENVTLVKLLLAKGADPNTKDKSDGSTSLQWAAQIGHAEMVASLLKSGADVNARDTFSGATALYFAAGAGHVGAVKALLAAGANPNVPDKFGDTMLDEVVASQRSAERSGRVADARRVRQVIQMLERAGAR